MKFQKLQLSAQTLLQSGTLEILKAAKVESLVEFGVARFHIYCDMTA